jgi:hypothetical protein
MGYGMVGGVIYMRRVLIDPRPSTHPSTQCIHPCTLLTLEQLQVRTASQRTPQSLLSPLPLPLLLALALLDYKT